MMGMIGMIGGRETSVGDMMGMVVGVANFGLRVLVRWARLGISRHSCTCIATVLITVISARSRLIRTCTLLICPCRRCWLILGHLEFFFCNALSESIIHEFQKESTFWKESQLLF